MKKMMILLPLFALLFSTEAFAGSVTGKVSFSGTAPEAAKISMDADPSCSALHSEAVYTEEVVVNANGTLKNVFVYVKAGLEGQTFQAPKEPAVIDQVGCTYIPHVMGVQTNQVLQIKNSDATLHNVHGLPKNTKEFNLGMPIKGMKIKRKFKKAEVMVKFKCDVHPWMSAYVGVVDHPYYAVSGDDGSFEIKDLPAGTYTLEAWHEKYGTQELQVTVGADGGTADFAFAA